MNQETARIASPTELEFSIEGLARYSGHVTLGGFLYQLRNLYEGLGLADRLISGRPEPTAEYRITDLQHSSPATVRIEARPRRADFDVTAEILDGFVGAMRQIAESGTAPQWVDRDLLERLRDLNKPVGRSVRSAKVVRNGVTVDLTKELAAKIEVILAPEETFEGSIKGKLEAINLHANTNAFRIYPAAGPSRVTCHFSDELRQDAIKAVDRYVIVSGILKYKANARFPEDIEVKEIETLPEPDELPTLRELRGVSPEATGDLTAAEFVRRIRDEWE
jgi:hypothetical protein